MTRARTDAPASPRAFRAFRGYSDASRTGTAVYGPARASNRLSPRFTQSTAAPTRDHLLDRIVRLDGARGEGPSPREALAGEAHGIVHRFDTSTTVGSTATANAMGLCGELGTDEAQHATAAQPQRVTAGPQARSDGGALASGDAENISASGPVRLDGAGGPWVGRCGARLSRVLGGAHSRLRSAAPAFSTIFACKFGLQARFIGGNTNGR